MQDRENVNKREISCGLQDIKTLERTAACVDNLNNNRRDAQDLEVSEKKKTKERD